MLDELFLLNELFALDKLLWLGTDVGWLLATSDTELLDDGGSWLAVESAAEVAATELEFEFESPPAPPQAVNARNGKK